MKNLKIVLLSSALLVFAQFAAADMATDAASAVTNTTNTAVTTTTGAATTAKASATAASAKVSAAEKINLNTASKEDIARLPGIGPKKADAIIAARPFKAPEDLMKVKGIKQATFNKIKNNVTIQ